MNEKNSPLTPWWFLILNSLLLVWNFFGLGIFVLTMTIFRSRDALEKAELNEEQIDLILSTPAWVNVAFGVAVVFGVLGCIALVVKRRLAIPLLAISLLGVLAQNTFVFFLSDTVNVMGVGASPLVILCAVALVPFSLYSAKRGWLT